jgi:flagellar basal body rod protein FlgG
MIRALSAAATGLEAQQTKIENIANDLANVNTDGYKRTTTEFQDLMYETIKPPGGALGTSSQSPVGIQVGMGVKVGAAHKHFEPGPARMTYNPLDLMHITEHSYGAFWISSTGGKLCEAYELIERPEMINFRIVNTEGAWSSIKISGDKLMIQADGYPMSGGEDNYNTTLQAISCADVINKKFNISQKAFAMKKIPFSPNYNLTPIPKIPKKSTSKELEYM